MLISRKKYDEMQRSLIDKENRLEKLRETLQDKSIEIGMLRRQIERMKVENQTLEASLDATAAALEQTRNTLAVSEQKRKQLLHERRR